MLVITTPAASQMRPATERIKLFKEVIGELRAALESRYPGRQFLLLFPKDDQNTPAV